MFVLTILEKIKKTRVKLANIQLKKLKFATKNKTGTISRLNKKKV